MPSRDEINKAIRKGKKSIGQRVAQERGISGKDAASGEREEPAPANGAGESGTVEAGALEPSTTVSSDAGAGPGSTQEKLPLGDTGNGKEPPKEITVRLVGPLVPLASRAFADRIETLEGLAKKTDAEGYARESRIFKADALTIKDHLLKQLRPQGDLGLEAENEVRAAIANKLRMAVAGYGNREFEAGRKSGKDDRKGSTTAARPSVEVLLGTLADLFVKYARGVSERSYAQGHVARTHTAEQAMLEALDSFASGVAEG